MFWPRRPPPPPEDEPPPAPPLPEADVIRRGEIASRLLSDPVLAGVFNDIRADYYRTWLNTEPDETAKREELFLEAKALDAIASKLRAYRDTGKARAARRADEDRAA